MFAIAGAHLGVLISDHINAFDPKDVFVLIADRRLLELVRPSLEPSIRRNAFAPLLQRTDIRIETPIKDWRWKGAAAHALEQTYLRESLPKAVRQQSARTYHSPIARPTLSS